MGSRADGVFAVLRLLILEKAIDHNVHDEHNAKTMCYGFPWRTHLVTDEKTRKLSLFVVLVVSLWFELRFLG